MSSASQADYNATAEEKLYRGDLIDGPAFSQILSMDDPGDHDFSKGIVYDFFTQAKETFVEIQEALGRKDLYKLSQRGHFLKGSSVTLGMNKVRDCCEMIQQSGKHQNLDGSPELDDKVCLKRISDAFLAVKVNVAEVEKRFRQFYDGDDASVAADDQHADSINVPNDQTSGGLEDANDNGVSHKAAIATTSLQGPATNGPVTSSKPRP